MVIDTSALVAMLGDEPDAARFEAAMVSDPVRLLSTGTLLETSIVIEARYGEAGGRELDLLLHKAQIEVVPFDQEQAELARLKTPTAAIDGRAPCSRRPTRR